MAFVQTDAQLRSLITAARDIIYACDAGGRFTYANPFALELMGYAEDEILGRHFSTLIRDDYRESAARFYGRQFVSKTPDTYFEYPAVLKSGDAVWLGQHVQLICDGGGNVTGFQAIARDITKQKDAEALLRESEAAYHSLVEHASLGILRSTVDGRILEANHALAEMLGYGSPEELLALPTILNLYMNPAERGPLLDRLLRDGRVAGVDVNWKRKDGSAIRAHVNSRVVRGADGVVRSIEVMIEDVTERERLAEQQRRTHTLEAVGQLAAGVAHHFNNLLTGMLGYTELLSMHANVSDEMRADLNEILKAGRRASVLTHQLLAFSDPRTPRLENLDLNHIVHGLHGRLARELRDNQTLLVEQCPTPAIVRIDSEDLQNVITQIVRNARDAMPSGGAVRIEVAALTDPEPDLPGHYVRLRIADSGVGMDWETQSRMFEPFFTTKPQDQGTGLGLSVTHGIIHNCGGTISVDSALGRGTTMNVYFPRP